ncbi:hypothetical protein AB0G40_32990, partial [Streptomyces griseorubiginosus]
MSFRNSWKRWRACPRLIASFSCSASSTRMGTG